MTKQIIAWSARNKFFVLLITAVAVGFAVQTLYHVPVDAIPDLSDTQVIVYSRWDRSPDLVEDQVTYPVTTALLGTPKVKAIRGLLRFRLLVRLRDLRGRDRPLLGAQPRARVPEQDPLEAPRRRAHRDRARRDRCRLGLPIRPRRSHGKARSRRAAVVPGLVPPLLAPGRARGRRRSPRSAASRSSTRCRSIPNRLLAYRIPVERVLDAVRDGNADSGGGLVEIGGAEYMVRARGYARSVPRSREDRRGRDANGDAGAAARSRHGDDGSRRCAAASPSWMAEGGTVGGIVVMRSGENALAVIDRVKAKIEEVEDRSPRASRSSRRTIDPD